MIGRRHARHPVAERVADDDRLAPSSALDREGDVVAEVVQRQTLGRPPARPDAARLRPEDAVTRLRQSLGDGVVVLRVAGRGGQQDHERPLPLVDDVDGDVAARDRMARPAFGGLDATAPDRHQGQGQDGSPHDFPPPLLLLLLSRLPSSPPPSRSGRGASGIDAPTDRSASGIACGTGKRRVRSTARRPFGRAVARTLPKGSKRSARGSQAGQSDGSKRKPSPWRRTWPQCGAPKWTGMIRVPFVAASSSTRRRVRRATSGSEQ